MPDPPEVISTNRARGGVTPHTVRYVLGISLILGVIALVWAFAAAPTATQHTTSPQEAAGTQPTKPPTPASR
jgi:hypothetical protein